MALALVVVSLCGFEVKKIKTKAVNSKPDTITGDFTSTNQVLQVPYLK
jgi:hypothetical protein